MKDSLYKCIEKIYIDKNFDLFKEKCNKPFLYLSELKKISEIHCIKTIVSDITDSPSIEIWFDFETYSCGDFVSEFKTLLKISKIANAFVFQHEFDIENKSPQKIEPYLNGYGQEPYIKSQYELENDLSNFLIAKGFVKCALHELDEVVGGMILPNQTIFGTQLTLENALFRDAYGIIDN